MTVCLCGHHKDKHDYLGCLVCNCDEYICRFREK